MRFLQAAARELRRRRGADPDRRLDRARAATRYRPEEALDREAAAAFHAPQVAALAEAGPDYLIAQHAARRQPRRAASPTRSRPPACRTSSASSSVPTAPCSTARRWPPRSSAIDAATASAPAGYGINCVHPSRAGRRARRRRRRPPGAIVLLPGERLGAEPRRAGRPRRARRRRARRARRARCTTSRARFGIRALGGCCGTGTEHIAALARRAPTASGGGDQRHAGEDDARARLLQRATAAPTGRCARTARSARGRGRSAPTRRTAGPRLRACTDRIQPAPFAIAMPSSARDSRAVRDRRAADERQQHERRGREDLPERREPERAGVRRLARDHVVRAERERRRDGEDQRQPRVHGGRRVLVGDGAGDHDHAADRERDADQLARPTAARPGRGPRSRAPPCRRR